MDRETFTRIRSRLGKHRREISAVLGVSPKAVESYEQGWRRVPANVERILYFLLFKLEEEKLADYEPCWETRSCTEASRNGCMAWEAHEGRFCWFFTGRLCGAAKAAGKRRYPCHSCAVFLGQLERLGEHPPRRVSKIEQRLE
jgi:hypothetical protein